jgi:integrase
MQRLARGAKLPAELVRLIGAHTGRVVFATLALDDGVPLHIVQDDLDHGDPRTTRGYHRKAKRLENAAGYRIAAILADES